MGKAFWQVAFLGGVADGTTRTVASEPDGLPPKTLKAASPKVSYNRDMGAMIALYLYHRREFRCPQTHRHWFEYHFFD